MIDAFKNQKLGDQPLVETSDRRATHTPLRHAKTTARPRQDEPLLRATILLQAISQAQLRYTAVQDLSGALTLLLECALTITKAQHICLREQNAFGEPSLFPMLCLAEANTQIAEVREQLAFVAGEVLQAGRALTSVASAQPQANPHPTTRSAAYFLGIPITIACLGQPHATGTTLPATKALLGALVISGHTDHFDPGFEQLLEPLLVTCAQLITSHRSEMRRRTIEQLREEEHIPLFQHRHDGPSELLTSHTELARIARAKDEFYATMNHELRTPLNAVLLYAESLLAQLPGPLNERQLRAVGSIREIADHILLLINDILDVAKLDAGKLSIDIKPCAIDDVCQGSIRLIAELAHRKRQTIHFECGPDVTELDVDERRLKQMLVNLLNNAVKFTPEGGTIGLEVVGDAQQNLVSFAVWDTGIGISEEDIARLFHPFIQIGSASHEAGTGLGLFLVRRMADLLGGNISVSSKVQQGSRFTLFLPWHQPHQDAVLVDLLPSSIAR